MEHRLATIIEGLVQRINEYNGADMLGGYMNQLAVDYNKELEELDFPTIEYCQKYPISVVYNETRDEVEVHHPASEQLLFNIPHASIELGDDVLYNGVALLNHIEKEYADFLDDMNF